VYRYGSSVHQKALQPLLENLNREALAPYQLQELDLVLSNNTG
jgi:hypothetical protein